VGAEPIAQRALRAAEAFRLEGRPASLEPLVVGHIHDSLVLTCRGGARPRRYLLQQLNDRVFPDPAAVVENVARVTDHLRGRLLAEGVADLDRRVLTLVPARAGGSYWRDPSGGWWRVYVLIEGAASAERLGSPGLARRTAAAFAGFARRLADLPPPRLRETLPGFHDTPARLAALAQAVERDPLNRARDAAQVIAATLARADDAGALARLQARGRLPERVVHNDTKVNNLLLDQASGEPLCVVDLDTVMPGLVAHDFGDLVRSAAATAAEDARDPGAAGVDPTLLGALATGYVTGWEGGVTGPELDSLALAPQVIALELATRFLTDHLEGDRYFRVTRPGHNLDRARVQLALARALEAQTDALARQLGRAARG
jgi:hypothetical protein